MILFFFKYSYISYEIYTIYNKKYGNHDNYMICKSYKSYNAIFQFTTVHNSITSDSEQFKTK